MDKINGNYKFRVEVAGDGFIHSTTIWATTFDEAEDKAKKHVAGCTEVRSIEMVDVTAFDVYKAILGEAAELELLKIAGAIDAEEAFNKLVQYVENINQVIK